MDALGLHRDRYRSIEIVGRARIRLIDDPLSDALRTRGSEGDASAREHRVAKGADLFICDASFFDTDDPSHISYQTLTSHRDALECERIVLTHLGAETLARIGELELDHAVDGTIIEVE